MQMKVIIEGEVQRVGYRNFVAKKAIILGIKGRVKNLKDGRVEIICDGKEATLKKFLKEINVKEPPLIVEKITSAPQVPKKKFKTFEIIAGQLKDELIEGFGAASEYLRTTRNELKSTHGELKSFRNESNQNLKFLGSEMSGLKSEIKSFRTETKENFNALNSKYDKISSIMETFINEMRAYVKGTQVLNEKLTEVIALLSKSYSRKKRRS
ncbi:MAG: acylphosphatase [Euryarchaeota archaeon]|nr:acylphosphatase [Euryarchaeota archaeon]